ncbi:unnamed protein product [Schistosoma mansoni]|uniref:Smp_205280 n=1 Tax=Schistosoma mansoni TaxID=6183 RepID=UPI00022C8235|nr:unnamed protein product [Schistosoma mansoni]|eukprot:XP_018644695.1 unnamed protein product [Schistosoma mansoni]
METVQHKGRYYKNILVKVQLPKYRSERITTAAWASPWRTIDLCALTILDLGRDQ